MFTAVLFLSYWKLSEDMQTREITEAAEAITESGTWPPDDVETVRWDTTVDNWGITVMEADDYEALSRAWTMWRASVLGAFEEAKTAPAVRVEENIEQSVALLEELPAQD